MQTTVYIKIGIPKKKKRKIMVFRDKTLLAEKNVISKL